VCSWSRAREAMLAICCRVLILVSSRSVTAFYLGRTDEETTPYEMSAKLLIEFCTPCSRGLCFTGKYSAEESLCPAGRAERLPRQKVRASL